MDEHEHNRIIEEKIMKLQAELKRTKKEKQKPIIDEIKILRKERV